MKRLLLTILTLASTLHAQPPDLNKLLNLTDVKSVEVEVGGLKVSHSDGVKRIPTEKLPLEVAEYYKLNTDEAKFIAKQAKSLQESQQKLDNDKQEILNKSKLKHFVLDRHCPEGGGIIVNEIIVREYMVKAHWEITGRLGSGKIWREDAKVREVKGVKINCFIPYTPDTKNLLDNTTFTSMVVEDGVKDLTEINGEMVKQYKLIQPIEKFVQATAKNSTP